VIHARTVAQRAAAAGLSRIWSNTGTVVFTAAFYLMVTAVLAALWSAAAAVNDGHIVGYSASALIWYIAASEAATIALPQRLIEEIGQDVKGGAIEIEMLRPASVLLVRLSTQFGAMIARLSICAACGVVFSLIFAGRPGDFRALALAGPAVVLALVLSLVAQHLFAAISFWMRDATATWFLYQKLIFVLGGMLLPLEVLPQTMETIARWLPFSAMAYIPARLASGHFEPHLLLIQLGWIAAIGAAATITFNAGQRRLLEAVS